MGSITILIFLSIGWTILVKNSPASKTTLLKPTFFNPSEDFPNASPHSKIKSVDTLGNSFPAVSKRFKFKSRSADALTSTLIPEPILVKAILLLFASVSDFQSSDLVSSEEFFPSFKSTPTYTSNKPTVLFGLASISRKPRVPFIWVLSCKLAFTCIFKSSPASLSDLFDSDPSERSRNAPSVRDNPKPISSSQPIPRDTPPSVLSPSPGKPKSKSASLSRSYPPVNVNRQPTSVILPSASRNS